MTIDAVAETDPLLFWPTTGRQWPALTRIACIVLATPATSGMAEQLFSTAGWLLSPRRASLAPEMLNKLVYLYYHMTAEMNRIGVPIKDNREAKRRRVGIALAKVQLKQIRNKKMLQPGPVELDDLRDDEDDDDEPPGPDPEALEEIYEEEELLDAEKREG